jgi:hypothetical protein
LWSVFKIRGAIATYQVFWLSALGTVNASIAAAWIAAAVPRRIPTAGIGILVGRAVPIALVAFVAVRGVRAIAAGDTNDAITPEHHAVRALSDRIIEELAASGGRRPVVRIDPSVWGVGAGVVLQLAKASVPFGVDELAALFGAPLAANGSEDLLVVVCGGQRHRELLEKPGVRQVGVYEHWYADFVPLSASGRLD